MHNNKIIDYCLDIVVPNIKDSNYESNAQLYSSSRFAVMGCSEYQR